MDYYSFGIITHQNTDYITEVLIHMNVGDDTRAFLLVDDGFDVEVCMSSNPVIKRQSWICCYVNGSFKSDRVNAHCLRKLIVESCVQVIIYDGCLEVATPRGLYNGQTFKETLQGYFKLRIRSFANLFCRIGLIEAWEPNPSE